MGNRVGGAVTNDHAIKGLKRKAVVCDEISLINTDTNSTAVLLTTSVNNRIAIETIDLVVTQAENAALANTATLAVGHGVFGTAGATTAGSVLAAVSIYNTAPWATAGKVQRYTVANFATTLATVKDIDVSGLPIVPANSTVVATFTVNQGAGSTGKVKPIIHYYELDDE